MLSIYFTVKPFAHKPREEERCRYAKICRSREDSTETSNNTSNSRKNHRVFVSRASRELRDKPT